MAHPPRSFAYLDAEDISAFARRMADCGFWVGQAPSASADASQPWTFAGMPDAERALLGKIDDRTPGAIRAYAARIANDELMEESFSALARMFVRDPWYINICVDAFWRLAGPCVSPEGASAPKPRDPALRPVRGV